MTKVASAYCVRVVSQDSTHNLISNYARSLTQVFSETQEFETCAVLILKKIVQGHRINGLPNRVMFDLTNDVVCRVIQTLEKVDNSSDDDNSGLPEILRGFQITYHDLLQYPIDFL